MKNIYFVMLVSLAVFSGLNTKSQNRNRFPLLRERIFETKLNEIKINLKLDQAAFEKFRPVYIRYESELSEIDFKQIAKLHKVDADSLTAEQADRLIVNQMEEAKNLILLREKYYKEFKKVLSPQQIIKVYQTEADILKKVTKEMKRRQMN